MKKILTISCILLASMICLAGCGTTSKVAETKPEPVQKSNDEANVDVQAYHTVIVDWQDRTIGAKRNPEWLLSLAKGNGNLYVDMNGLADYANDKWFVSSAQDRVLKTAETVADMEILLRVGQEMANTVNATIGANLSDGQKDTVRTICSKVNNVTLNDVGKRGSYWQLEKTTDEYGNSVKMYNFYSIYSCSKQKYNQLLNTYLIALLKSKELDINSVNEIKSHAQEILNDAQQNDDEQALKKEREWKSQLIHEQTERVMAREETMRQQSANAAEAAANLAPGAYARFDNAGEAQMDPALAALIGAM